MTAPLTPLAIDFDAARKALVACVVASCGLDQNHVIMAEGEGVNTPRPTVPFVTIKIMTPATRYGSDSPQPVPGTTLWTFSGPRGMSVSFNAFGSTHEQAYGILTTLQGSLDMPPAQGILAAGGVVLWKQQAVTDISELMNTGYEGRAHMDVLFGLNSSLTVDLGSIDTINVAGSIEVA